MGKKISTISSNSVIYSVQPQIIRKQLNMSQSFRYSAQNSAMLGTRGT